MGTDIHFFAEKRNTQGQFEFLPAPDDGYNWKEKKRAEEAGFEYECAHPYRSVYDRRVIVKPGYESWDGAIDENPFLRDWFDDRNYKLFGMLADVRNGSGFAGCDTGDSVEPIVMPRGFPTDACPEIQAEWHAFGDHSSTYLTLREMLDYFERKNTQPMTVRGVVTGQIYEEFKRTGEPPESYSGGISGNGIITLAPNVYDLIQDKVAHREQSTDPWQKGETVIRIVDVPEGIGMSPNEVRHGNGLTAHHRKPGERLEEFRVYVRAEWEEPYSAFAGHFMDLLAELQKYGSPDDIRCVFWFDS